MTHKQRAEVIALAVGATLLTFAIIVALSERAEAALLGDEPVTYQAYRTNERTADAWQRADRSARTTTTVTSVVAPAPVSTARARPRPTAAATAGAQVGYGSDAKMWIYNKESGNNPCAYYPGKSDCNYAGEKACGLGGALPCSKMRNTCPDLSNYACQDAWFTGYMQSRYGTWEKAKAFHQSRGWW